MTCHTAIFLEYVNNRDIDSFYSNLSKGSPLKIFFSHTHPFPASHLLSHCRVVLNGSLFPGKRCKITVFRNVPISDISPFTIPFLERSGNKGSKLSEKIKTEKKKTPPKRQKHLGKQLTSFCFLLCPISSLNAVHLENCYY